MSDKDRELRELVEDLMIHRPCGNDPEAYCRQNIPGHWKACNKHFPKDFATTTRFGDKNYPEYKRQEDGQSVKLNDGKLADNRHQVVGLFVGNNDLDLQYIH